MIEELGSYPHVCLVTTSRMDPDIPGFHRIEVSVPSGMTHEIPFIASATWVDRLHWAT